MQEKIAQLLQEKRFEAAFNSMVAHYSERLYYNIRRLVLNHDDADDVLQNTFIKVWRALPKFQQNSSVYTWLYRIATNEALSFLRSKKENTRFDDVAFSVSKNLEADAFFSGDEAQAKLYEAIATLPEKQRAVFNARYFEEMSYADMSATFDTSEGALKASYHHAVKKIESYLTKH